MVFGLIRDLFDNEKREIALSKYEYNKCKAQRQARLSQFRISTVRELKSKYEDNTFLFNHASDKFISYTSNGGITMFGRFVDEMFPSLDYIGEDDSAYNRNISVSKYLSKIDRYDKEPFPDLASAYSWWKNDSGGYREHFNQFMESGYYCMQKYDNASLLGCRIIYNEIEIANASVWSQQIDGYFARNIYNKIISNNDKIAHHLFNTIKLQLAVYSEGGLANDTSYEFIHFGVEKYDINSNKSHFSNGMTQISVFMNAIESEFRAIPEELRELLSDYAPSNRHIMEACSFR